MLLGRHYTPKKAQKKRFPGPSAEVCAPEGAFNNLINLTILKQINCDG
jgi:hypothetical protein